MPEISEERLAELEAKEKKLKRIETKKEIIQKHQEDAKLEDGWIKLGKNNYRDKQFWEFRELKRKIKKSGKRYKKFVNEFVNDLKYGRFNGFYKLVYMQHVFTDDELKLLDRELKKLITDTQKVILTIYFNDGEKSYFTYTNKSRNVILDLLKTKYWEHKEDVIITSGGLDRIKLQGLDQIDINVVKKKKKRILNTRGKFFEYINTTNIDLTRYQIIKEDDDIDNVKEHCLIHTLRLHGISEDILNNIKLTISNVDELDEGKTVLFHFAKKNLKEVAEKIQKKILLHEQQKDNKKKIYSYGKFDQSIDICLYKDHYFIYDKKTDYTEYSINNYHDVRYQKDFNNIIKCDRGSYKRRKDFNKINSFRLIQLLFEKGHFTKDSAILSTIDDYQRTKDHIMNIPLSNIDKEQREVKFIDKKEVKYDIFYADTETCTTDGEHKCILAGIMHEKDNEVQIYKDDPIKNMFDYILNNSPNGNPIVYFHVLKYDMNIYKNYVHHIDICEKDNNIYSNTIIYEKLQIKMKDSYKIIPEKLAKFNKMFQLPENLDKKEAIGFTYYNKQNMNVSSCTVKEYMKHVSKKSKDQLIKNLEKNPKEFEYDKVNFNPIKYYMYYLKYDVLVLKTGIQTMHNIIYDICDLNIHDYLTISSLTNHYMKKNGAFDELYEVSGNLREYLSNTIYGGRVDVNQKQKKRTIYDKLVDYDAVSLYPSAIVRVCLELGFPKGSAKRITTTNKKDLDKLSYYFVTIKVKSINKTQQIPFFRKAGHNECIYTNEISKDELCVVDKCTLDDLINFHKIEYDIIDGVYYDQGFNKKMGDIVTSLFEQRSKYKDEGNQAMQQILKLMLNSSYGKTIMKKSKTAKTITDHKDINDKICDNYNNIISLKPLNDNQTLIISNKYDDTFNLSTVGSMILSYSKRIMNEVMNIANDNDITIYYQDTDSMHMKQSDVSKLENLYEQTYDKKLQGSKMGQFHSDFEMSKNLNHDGVSPIYSTMSIFLGKKCYMDKLESLDKNGNIINDYHIRMKGITKEGLEHSLHIFDSYENVFKHLMNNGAIDFLLNPPDKTMFEYNNKGVITRGEFYRTVSFKDKFKF